MRVPLLDLSIQYEGYKERALKAIGEVCNSQAFALGPAVARFEENVAAYCGLKHAIGVSSGTDALLHCRKCPTSDIPPGSQMILSHRAGEELDHFIAL